MARVAASSARLATGAGAGVAAGDALEAPESVLGPGAGRGAGAGEAWPCEPWGGVGPGAGA